MDETHVGTCTSAQHVCEDEDLPLELRAIAQRYAAQPVPRPTSEDTARLLARLLAEEPSVALALPRQRRRIVQALRMARWHVRLLGAQFWVASVLLLALGAALAPALGATLSLPPHGAPEHGVSATALPFVLLAPLAAVLGLAYGLRTSSRGLREVEASAPIGFTQVATGLALAIVGFDCMLGALATAWIALLGWAPFVALLCAWLAPMLLLTGISLPIALRWGTRPAVLVGGGPWLLLAVAAGVQPHDAYALAIVVPQDTVSLTLHFIGALLGLLLLLLLLVRGTVWPVLPSTRPS